MHEFQVTAGHISGLIFHTDIYSTFVYVCVFNGMIICIGRVFLIVNPYLLEYPGV